MFNGYDRKANVMALTDTDVSTDWRNGLLKNVAELVIQNGRAEGTITGAWGSILGYKEDSLAKHFYEGKNDNVYVGGTGDCAIVSVTNLEEINTERYEHDSFGPGQVRVDSGIQGIVTCEHGITGRMVFNTSVGELIYTLASQN